jgi:hypothetical protein
VKEDAAMSQFQEFCKSHWVGRTKAEEEHLEHEKEVEHLSSAVGALVRRLCGFFQCPGDRAHYVDVGTNTVSGPVEGGTPRLCFRPESGRYRLALEITVGDDRYPVWLKFEFALPKHGGFEVHFGPSLYQVPAEEQAFFGDVADAVNHQLRQGCPQPPLRIGW